MIQTINLTKKYASFFALEDVSLHVNPGEIYGFLGPNGSGKTTAILALLGIEKPTSGEVLLFGQHLDQDYHGIKRRIGVLGENQYLYDNLTCKEYLRFFARLYDVHRSEARIQTLLERVDLASFADTIVKNFSRGMQQKLGIVRALLHDPELLILDEPVSALDPYGILEIRTLLQEQNRQGKTIFISSHILSEVELTAHRVGIILNGKLIAEDTISNLKNRLAKQAIIHLELEKITPQIVAGISELPFITNITEQGNFLELTMKGDRDYRSSLFTAVSNLQGVILSMANREISLEDAFISLTENNLIAMVDQKEKE